MELIINEIASSKLLTFGLSFILLFFIFAVVKGLKKLAMIACIVAGLIIGYVHFSKKDDSMFSEKSISIPEENSSSLVQVDNMTKDGYRLWKHQDGRS